MGLTNFDITQCFSALDNILWEKAIETCKPLILPFCPLKKNIFESFPSYELENVKSCLAASIVSDLNPSLKVGSEQVDKVANNTLLSLNQSFKDTLSIIFWEAPWQTTKQMFNNPYAIFENVPCTVFSKAVGYFQQQLELDPKLVDSKQQIVDNTLPWFSDITCRMSRCFPWPSYFEEICPVQD